MGVDSLTRATFVRHGQSTGNAGQPTRDLVAMPLTPLGVAQARQVAAGWTGEPTHIVSSPFLRARQTAEPSCVRFPGVPMAIWPIHEFTYLCPARWADTTRTQRRPAVEAYWQLGDPAHVDGEGAESFSQVLRRAEQALARLAALPEDAEVFLFSHGQFMQAVRLAVERPADTDDDRMARFWPFDQRSPVLNCQKLVLGRAQGAWRVLGDELLMPPEMPLTMEPRAASARGTGTGGRHGPG